MIHPTQWGDHPLSLLWEGDHFRLFWMADLSEYIIQTKAQLQHYSMPLEWWGRSDLPRLILTSVLMQYGGQVYQGGKEALSDFILTLTQHEGEQSYDPL